MSFLRPLVLGRALLWLAIASLAACVSGGGFQAGSTLRSVDNDAFDHSDDQYTSGLAVSLVPPHEKSFAETSLPDYPARLLDEVWPESAGDQRFVIHSVSHRVFTPTDLGATEVVQDDLPYSALLYGTVVVGSQSRDALNAVSVSLGVAGPLALGEEVQATLHGWIGSEEPRGWDNQIENEPLVNFGFDARRRLVRVGAREGLGADLLAGLSGSLGNLQTQATLAATARVGLGVPTNFHMQTPFLTEESVGLRSYDAIKCNWSAYLFVGAGVTALANAIYLDGNTFEDSHSVSHDHHVVRTSLGLSVRYKKILATVALESATVPWDHPDGLTRENYARFGLSWDF